MSPAQPRPRPRRAVRPGGSRLVAPALALLLGAPALASAAPWSEHQVADTIARSQHWVAPEAVGDAVAIPVDVATVVILPLEGAEVLELDYQSEGLITLSWCAANQGGYKPFGWLWRYAPLRQGQGRLRLDLRTTFDYRPTSSPALIFMGTGRVVLTGLRSQGPEPTEAEQWAAVDRARLLAPESFSHVIDNTLGPSYWRASREEELPPRLGLLLVVGTAAALLAAFALRRRWRPAAPLAAALLLGVAASDAHALLKLAPPWRLATSLDPEQRLRDGFPLAPELGALAAAARAALPTTARVAVLGRKKDWFGPQTLCFHLAPRPCVVVRPGLPTQGISGVTTLRDDEIDAVVLDGAEGGLPPGFTEVARVSPRALVARRP